jgi:1-acyl-sn-glycerol-3-phosphate acyltransferase
MNFLKSLLAWSAVILFLIIYFPFAFIIWLIVLPFDRKRTVIHWLLIFHGEMVTRMMPFWKTTVKGREKIIPQQTYVIISNHQSTLDLVVLCCLRCRFRWISKIENLKVPPIGLYIRMAKYITVDRGNEESKALMLARCYQTLREGISILIFPEGTRSLNTEIGFFRRGAFQLAIEAKVPVVPVVVEGTGSILPKHGFKVKSGHRVRLNVLDPVHPAEFGTDNPDELSVKFSNIMKEELRKMRSDGL